MKTLHENLHNAYQYLFASQKAHILALYRALTQGIDLKDPQSVLNQILEEIVQQAEAHCNAKEELMALTLHEELKHIMAENRNMLNSCQTSVRKIQKNKGISIKDFAEGLNLQMQKCFIESDEILNHFSKYSALNLGKFTPGKDLSVHISVFDIQHRNIHFLMDSIIHKSEKKEARHHCLDLIDDLMDKNAYHFDCEEKIMAQYKFPLLEEHRKEHTDFKNRMLVYRDKYVNNTFEASETSMFEIIKMQIEDHIINVDQKYTQHFNNLGII